MTGGRLFAWANLAYHFGAHMARKPLEWLGRRDGASSFRQAVEPEGYLPLSPDERAEYPSFMRCTSCGLCALACPVLRESPASAWEEAQSFVTGPARSIDRAAEAAADIPPCTRCGECEAICPVGVPIPRLAAMVERLGAVASTARETRS